jgi:ubiquinone/menaquinone biosynthesis C-methylase UbiE
MCKKELNMEILKRKFLPERVKKDYSKVAWIYDAWSLFTESKAATKVLEFAEIDGRERILDVAVGTGVLFKKIVLLNSDGFTEGIDISPSMLKHAEKRLSGSNFSNYKLEEGNAYSLQFEDNYFDLVINNYMLDLLPEEDFTKILDEFYRVLRPGGKVVISSMACGNNWNNKLWYKISKSFPVLMTNCRPIALEKHIMESGFNNIKSFYITQNTFPSEVIMADKN